jgi:SMI1 / KNR4 family (SUKH-1)
VYIYVQQAVDTLESSRGFALERVSGCTVQQVAAMEALLPASHRLPGAYREFLLYGGESLLDVFNGLDISYQMSWSLLSHGKRDIIKMLRTWDPNPVLPPELFFVNEHLGSNCTFFKLSEGDDPPIYFWEEGEGGLECAVRQYDRFSAFLLDLIRKSIRHREGALQ